jgi:hypothetical protein
MAYSRYRIRGMFMNEDMGYQKSILDSRDLKNIMQYETARFNYPTEEELETIPSSELVWGTTSKLYNLAHDFYGAPEMWWVIAWFNQKPTEAHFNVGDVIYIPTDMNQALKFFERF